MSILPFFFMPLTRSTPPIKTRHEPALPGLQFINPEGLYDPAPNGYTHVVTAPLGGAAGYRLVQVAGQGGERPDGSLPADFETQLAQALANLNTALGAAGAALDDVTKLTVLIVDHSHERLQTLSRHVQQYWPRRPAPACTLIPVARLALDGMLFEVEATAVVAGNRSRDNPTRR
ncbi:MAG: RutC family protein YjgH [Paracidovorax wautersii]|uniref:RutC family protein YjgH n=1 Tax=Paracidovorax wautersii TaxID=1177982 RepID=A0A7V8FQ76_9BURK|nr:MAG: RutC family protein YjgH [Paracidovorax wautersii]